jgi:hypothetical protein
MINDLCTNATNKQPDPECALSETRDSLNTQPDWRSMRSRSLQSKLEQSRRDTATYISTDLKMPLQNESIVTIDGSRGDMAHPSGVSRAQLIQIRFQFVSRFAREAFDKVKTTVNQEDFLNVKFLLLPIFVALLGYVAANSVFNFMCKNTGNPSFLDCAVHPRGNETKSDQSFNNPILVQLQIQTLNNVVENSQGIGKTAIEIRRTGIVMSELETLLEASDIASKNELSEAISKYRMHSFHVGRGLERFRSNLLATLGG